MFLDQVAVQKLDVFVEQSHAAKRRVPADAVRLDRTVNAVSKLTDGLTAGAFKPDPPLAQGVFRIVRRDDLSPARWVVGGVAQLGGNAPLATRGAAVFTEPDLEVIDQVFQYVVTASFIVEAASQPDALRVGMDMLRGIPPLTAISAYKESV